MRILPQRGKILLTVILAVFIAAYHFTPFYKAVDLLKKPLFGALGVFYSITRPVNHLWFAISRGAELSDDLQQQRRIISLLQSKELDRDFCGISFDDLSSINAKAVMISSRSKSRFMLIDKGSKDGVFEGAAVITPESEFVGKVLRSGENFSYVSLVTESESAIAVSLASDRSIQAIARGKSGLGLRMELIPQDADIKSGDIIITSLLEENTPQGLLVGTVSSVVYSEGQLFKEANLSPFISIQSLNRVLVVVPPE